MSELSNAIEGHVGKVLSKIKTYSSICKVVSVDDLKRTCEVEPINGDAERTGRLQTSLELTEGLYIKPSIDSFVQLTWINEITGIITKYSEIESIQTTTNTGASFTIETKFNVSNNDTDLKVILDDLITAIKNITVPTPSGTSGTPLNFADFDIINQDINNLLE